MKHQLSLEDLDTFESSVQLAGSFGKGSNKSLTLKSTITITGTINSWLDVMNKSGINETHLTYDKLEDAINYYNDLP